jgi:hypothetical protein
VSSISYIFFGSFSGSLGLVITRCVWEKESVCAHRINQSKVLDIHVIKKKKIKDLKKSNHYSNKEFLKFYHIINNLNS